MSMANSSDTIANRKRDRLVCSAVPQPTAPLRAPKNWYHRILVFDAVSEMLFNP